MKEIVELIKSIYPNQEYIPLHVPVFNGNEKKYVLDTIHSTIVSSIGEYVNRFENMICRYTGASHAVATVNGSSALHLGLMLAGVKKNQLVITQALSFVATSNAIRYIGADPLYVDVDADTMSLSPNALKRYIYNHTNLNKETGEVTDKITGKTIAACVPMHTYGFPAKIDEIVEICAESKIPVIEDAAESLGTFFKGKHTGTFGLLGIFSFNGNKIVTSGGGGMIITRSPELAKKAKHLSTQAKMPHEWEYYHDEIGFNYRCPNINAALACAQMEQLEQIIDNKRNTANRYRDFFNTTDIRYLEEPTESRSNYWLNSVLFTDKEERDRFLKYSNAMGIMTRPAWALLNKLPMYSQCFHDGLEISRFIEERLVNLPSSVAKNISKTTS